MISDAEVIEELTGGGGAIADYFFIGESFHCFNSRGVLMGIAADDEMGIAMEEFLGRAGAPVYASESEARRLHFLRDM